RCRSHLQRLRHRAPRSRLSGTSRTLMQTTTPTIDVHTHYVPKGWPDLEEATGGTGPWPWLRVENEREAMIMVGSSEFRPLSANAWHADERLEQMDADGIDIQVVSPTPLFFSYAR